MAKTRSTNAYRCRGAWIDGQVISDAAIEVSGARIVQAGRWTDNRSDCVCQVTSLDGTEVPGIELYAVPGFVDLHVHGGGGGQFLSTDIEAQRKALMFHRNAGTTSLLATLSGDIESNLKAIQSLVKLHESGEHPELAGIHLEGPFINPARKGAFADDVIVPPSLEQLERLCEAANGLVKLVTLAPEMDGAQELVCYCRGNGIVVAAGHTEASYEKMVQSFEWGVAHACHTFNAMPSLHHREPGVTGAILSTNCSAEVICDGIHVHPAVVKALVRAKGPEEVCLITDAIALAGMPDGTYFTEGVEVHLKGSEARLTDGTLCGSTLTMESAVQTAIEKVGIAPGDVFRMASGTPAKVIGLQVSKGTLRADMDADIVFLDSEWNVHAVMIGGEFIVKDFG